MKRNVAFVLIVIVAWGFVASDSLAASKAANSAQQAANAQRNKEEQTAEQAHEAAVNEAQKALDDAQSTLDEIALKAQNAFEKSPQDIAADTELTADQKAYDTASSAVLRVVDASPAYVAAKARSDKSQAELADLQQSGGSETDITAKAAEAMQDGSAAHKMESDALAADPATAAAQTKLTAAQKAMDALKLEFHNKLTKKPAYAAAKSVVDAADKRLIAVEAAGPGYVPAVITAKGKITHVDSATFTILVIGAKNKATSMTVNYTSSAKIIGAANNTIDQSAVGKTATVVGSHSSSTITASTIIITATPRPKKPGTA